MTLKKISIKEWKKLGLPSNTSTIHVGPYFKWDFKKKKFDKPVVNLTYKKKYRK